MRRVAVASDDGEKHRLPFRALPVFVVYEIDEQGNRRREVKPNKFTGHSRGECDSSEGHEHGHSGIIAALAGCEAVICRGMGDRARADLESAGIKPLFITRETDIAGAIEDYFAGRLSEQGGVCPGHRD